MPQFDPFSPVDWFTPEAAARRRRLRTSGGFAAAVAGPASHDFTAGSISGVTFTRDTAGTYFDASGDMQTAAANAARFDHDPDTLTALGLLIEQAQTNVAKYSAEFNQATWAKTGITVTTDNGNGLDGAATADKLAADTGNTQHMVGQNIGVLATGEWTARIVVENIDAPYIFFSLHTASARYAYMCVDTATWTVAASGATAVYWSLTSATVTALPGGKYLLTLVANNLVGAAAVNVRVGPGTSSVVDVSGQQAAYVGVGESFRAWGADVVAGTKPTSHIPTTSAAATRNKDEASESETLDTENALVVTGRTATFAGTQTIISLDDGTADERVYIERNASNEIHCIVVDGGVTQCDLNLGAVVNDTDFKVAFRVVADDFAACLDGGVVQTDTTGTLPTVTTLNYGQDYAGANQLNATLKTVQRYDVTKSNAELQSLTA